MAGLSATLCAAAAAAAAAAPPAPYVETWPVIAEAENFTVTPEGSMSVVEWGRGHLYGATFSNTFASRKALLSAAPGAVGKAASGPVAVPRAGTWYACVRYEAAYRFETEFTVTISQGGSAKLAKLYGQRASPKIWPFGWSQLNHEIAGCGANPTPECHWTWGATENWVWEFYPVTLTEGSVTIDVSVDNATSAKDAAPLTFRNVDAVLLTQNLSNIQHRMVFEQQLALDGLFSQHDEVFARVQNTGSSDMQLEVPFAAYHSAYPSQHMICVPYCTSKYGGPNPSVVIPAPRGSTSPWVEVGSRLDAFNDGTLTVTAAPLKPPPAAVSATVNSTVFGSTGFGLKPPPPPPPPPFRPSLTVEFGVATRPGGAVESIGSFSTRWPSTSIEVAFDANTVATKRVRVVDAALPEAVAEAEAGPVPPGSKGSVTKFPVFGYTFCTAGTIRDIEPSCYLNTSVSPQYKANLERFLSMIPISDTSAGDPETQATGLDRGQGYLEARAIYHNLTKLTELMEHYQSTGVADKVMVVSMGDEISLADPADAKDMFAPWCKSHGYPAADCARYNATDPSNPKSFWYSNLFRNAAGLSALAPATAVITKYLKNAGVGANYSPLTYTAGGYVAPAYFYPVNKAVTMFRTGSMTLPWGEDYTWQSPVGTQQMTSILLDLFRAGIRTAKTPATKQIMFYAMAHAPGNTPASWRRNFYNYLAHGMTRLNLYEMRPCTASYTENYVDVGWGMYGAARTALAELATFEDIVVGGDGVAPGDVGLWASDAGDVWVGVTEPSTYGQHQSTFTAAKRALYVALLHAELPVDVVVEDDIGPTLDSYRVIYLCDTHVTQKASAALAAWVAAGGTLVATANGGMWDEFNHTNTALQSLFGVAAPRATREPSDSAVQYIKQDLRFASVIDTVNVSMPSGGGLADALAGAGGLTDPVTFPAVGFVSVFDVPAGSKATVTATFASSGAPAATRASRGTGAAHYFGFLPGFSYFLPAMPSRPTDRGGTDAAYTHFVPTNFSSGALGLIAAPAANASRHVNSSDPLVHGRVVASAAAKGAVVPLTLWRDADAVVADLSVTVTHPSVKPGMRASLASGRPVAEAPGGRPGSVTFTLPGNFTVADALVLRA